jgi:hypothetical protein
MEANVSLPDWVIEALADTVRDDRKLESCVTYA